MELTSKQRAQLRGLANTIDTIIHIGKDGIGENLVKQTDDALEARELIKGRVLENNIEYDARLAAQELAKATRSEVVQVIGTRFVLYRESHSKPKEKRIQLVFDHDVKREGRIAFHPCDNTATVVFAQEVFWTQVVPTLGHEPIWL